MRDERRQWRAAGLWSRAGRWSRCGGGRWFSQGFLRGYAVRVKQIDCVCGVVVKGEDDDELWERAQEHLRSDHPELVGKVSRADILAQAEET
jgi:predicted small metal-binding protein